MPPALIERDLPLARLTEAVLQAAAGHGRVALVSGEAGIGKSSLVQALVAGLAPHQRMWWGACEALFTPRPLGPLHDIAIAQRGRLLALIDQGAAPAAVFAAFLDLLRAPAAPTVVVFEDMHWADQATLDLVKFLGRRLAGLPALLLLTYRDDELDSAHPLRSVLGDLPAASVTRIALAPLSALAVDALSQRSGRPLPGLFDVTGGNPFYVTEVLASGGAPHEVPSSVVDAVLARVSRLGAMERSVLDAVSVEPGRIESRLVERLLGGEAAPAIDACVARGVLRSADGMLMFRHELARRATLDALKPLRRQALHRQVLAALAEQPHTPLARLVHHAAEAADAAQVLELAPPAAAGAARLGAHREAAAHYATALRFIGQVPALPAATQALLHESWSYEAGLALQIDDAVIAARHRAIALWKEAGRADKVGHNLRWLSRLHWYRGEQRTAEQHAEQAVQVLEALPVGPELAMAYSVRSQMHMLQDRTDDAIAWGERALALAQQPGDVEIRIHALNNIGTAKLFANRPGGHALLEESLALALQGGFHEHAARVYTNLGEHAVVFKDFARAETHVTAGIAFDTEHDLDAWTHYLTGWLAQLRLEQGRFDEAQQIAQQVLAIERLTLVMRLPALTTLARLQVRRGDANAGVLLAQAQALAQPTGESQRIVPVVCGLCEAAWLRGDAKACQAALRLVDGLPGVGVNPWEAGELAVWRRRGGDTGPVPAHAAAPYRAELSGDALRAARDWEYIGAPYEQALALMQVQGSDASAALSQAVGLLERMGALPAAQRARERARQLGLQGAMPKPRRGPYAHARQNSHGLTARELQVLRCIAEGLRNAEIAQRMARTERTVEHHVSALLAKLQVSNRSEAAALARREGLVAAQPEDPAAASGGTAPS